MSKLRTFWSWKNRPAALAVTAMIVGGLAVIVSISNFMQGPTAAEPPNAAEWLSAISTFWGAVAAAIGAVLTGGALLIAALTYQRQVKDRHAELEQNRREQAQAVTVNISRYAPRSLSLAEPPQERLKVEVRNDSHLAIYGGALVVSERGNNRETAQQLFMSILPGESESFIHPENLLGAAYATFTDTAGVRWKRWHNGDLEEIAHYPTTQGE